MTEDALPSDRSPGVHYHLVGTAGVALLVGVALALPARAGAVQLLVAVAVVQALLAVTWVLGLHVPGRIGATVIAGLAAAAADVTVSVWPHSQLGTLLVIVGLAVPVMFVHQLSRGAARVRVVESLGGIALLVVAEVSLPALLQLRHEFIGVHGGADGAFGVIVIATSALVVGNLVDLTSAPPRFDRQVPRGLPAVLASAAVGAALGHLTLRDLGQLDGGRDVFTGAALGVLVALLAVTVSFIEYAIPTKDAGLGRRVRPILGVVFPLSLLAPLAFVVCLAIRR